MKKEMGAFNWLYPLPVVLLGAMVNGRPTYNTLGNCGIISMHPCMLYVSSQKEHYTNRGVREGGAFSVNLPDPHLAEKADYCGLVSGRDADKSQIFTTFYGKTGAPMIQECPVSLEATVLQTVGIGGMDVFIGQVVQSYIDERCFTEGKPDMQKINPLFYEIRGGYRALDGFCAPAFKIGKTLMK